MLNVNAPSLTASDTSSTQQKPKAAIPLAGTAPPPLSTSDPMAFDAAPAAPVPTLASPSSPSGGQNFIGGTASEGTNGVLGNGYVPYSNGQLVDLGGGMVAPTPGVDVSQGISLILPPNIAPDRPYYSGDQAYNIGQEVPGQGILSGYDPTTGLPVFNNSGPVMTGPAPTSLADLVNPNTAPASGGSGYASSGNLVPASGPAQIAPAGSPPVPQNPSTEPVPSQPSVTPPSGSGPVANPGNAGTGVNLTPTTIDNALTNYTISPDNTVDRVKLAQDALQSTIQNVLDPQFHTNERDANRYNFGAGRGVSGIARTNQGDIVSDYNRQKANLANTLLNAATNGSIEDLYRNIGIAQQQQGFQAGQQKTAFDEGLQQLLAG